MILNRRRIALSWLPDVDWPLVGLGVGIVAIIAFITVAVFWTRPVTVIMASHEWSREIQIEDYGPRHESAWCNRKPNDAYDVTVRREKSGETCTQIGDNNICTNDYDDKCYYTVDRWRYKRSATANGAGRKAFWPEFTLEPVGNCYGCEREGQRRQRYVVSLHEQNGDGHWACDLDYPMWSDTADGSLWAIEIRHIGNTPKCNTLQPRF